MLRSLKNKLHRDLEKWSNGELVSTQKFYGNGEQKVVTEKK